MITASGLTKRYDGFTALDDVSFSFPEAGIFGIVGHNGAGKTTLLKIIAGLVPPSAGELSVNGIDVVRAPMALKETLGYLPEESRLYETMTADEYLAFFGEIYGIEKEEIAVRTRRLFAVLSLEPNGKKLGEFSKGMKRKTAIARSLIHDPKFLVYDEPTSGLDPMTSRFIAEYLGKLKSEGRTIVPLGSQPVPGRGDLRPGDDPPARESGGAGNDGRAPRAVRLDYLHHLVFRTRSVSHRPAYRYRTGRMRGVLPAMPGIWPASKRSLPPLR